MVCTPSILDHPTYLAMVVWKVSALVFRAVIRSSTFSCRKKRTEMGCMGQRPRLVQGVRGASRFCPHLGASYLNSYPKIIAVLYFGNHILDPGCDLIGTRMGSMEAALREVRRPTFGSGRSQWQVWQMDWNGKGDLLLTHQDTFLFKLPNFRLDPIQK